MTPPMPKKAPPTKKNTKNKKHKENEGFLHPGTQTVKKKTQGKYRFSASPRLSPTAWAARLGRPPTCGGVGGKGWGVGMSARPPPRKISVVSDFLTF